MNKLGEFQGTLGKYTIIETEDHSCTVLSSNFDEACHSLNGAIAETNYNYIEGCELLNNIQKYKEFNIFEMGFGVGIGLKCTIDFIEKNNIKTPINFFTCELDDQLVQWALQNGDLKTYGLESSRSDDMIKMTYNNIQIFISLGNIRQTLYQLIPKDKKIHAIFQDPFSPKRNPICWTLEYFKDLYKIAHEDVLLSTYSSSKSIRKTMIAAGWTIIDRKGFGQKRLATQGKKTGNTKQDIIDELARSPVEVLRD